MLLPVVITVAFVALASLLLRNLIKKKKELNIRLYSPPKHCSSMQVLTSDFHQPKDLFSTMNPSYIFQPELCESMDLHYHHDSTMDVTEMPVLSLTPDVALPPTTTSAGVVPTKIGSSSAASSSGGASSSRSFAAELKQLAADFQPGPYDVICAR